MQNYGLSDALRRRTAKYNLSVGCRIENLQPCQKRLPRCRNAQNRRAVSRNDFIVCTVPDAVRKVELHQIHVTGDIDDVPGVVEFNSERFPINAEADRIHGQSECFHHGQIIGSRFQFSIRAEVFDRDADCSNAE